LLRSVVELRAPAPIYLVRHAKAGVRHRWTLSDEDRPLTRRGRRQARRLVEQFRGLEIARIVSSPFARCVQSVEPLARSRGLEVETTTPLGEGAEVEDAVAFFRTLGDEPVVLCGHGREIAAVVAVFEADGAVVAGVRGLAKGSVWVLDREDGRIVSARYLPAPSG
jgi:8-oxo-dGTP diphosphatase